MNILIQKSASGFLAVALLFTLAFSFSNPARAESTSSQMEQIQTLLAMIEQLQAQLAQMRGGSSSGGQCTELSRSLFLGSSDSDSSGQVSKLQRFLTDTGHYSYGEITGYYGPATQQAVQAWQASKGVVSSGSPETTGYGVVGPSTRSAMARGCVSASKPAVVPVKVDESKPSCTIKSSDKNPEVGETFTISWTTENITDPAFNEGMKAGGSYEVEKNGSRTFSMSSAYTATFGISEELDKNQPLCSVEVQANDVSYAELDVQGYSESKTLILGNKVIGKELLSFRVDADNAGKNVLMTEVPVYIGLPFVKAGLWSDMLKNVVLCSEKTQQCVNMNDEVETDFGGIELNGVSHDEIRVTFDLSDYESDFTIPKGVTRDFTIIADFNPANTVGGFGADKGVSAGYVQAVVGEVQANVKIEREDVEGPVIYVKGKSY